MVLLMIFVLMLQSVTPGTGEISITIAITVSSLISAKDENCLGRWRMQLSFAD